MIALWLLTGCSGSDPALGEWLCAERWAPAGWQACPIEGTTWQLSLGPEDATFYSVDVASAAFEGRDLQAVAVAEGAWTLTEVVEVPDPGARAALWSGGRRVGLRGP